MRRIVRLLPSPPGRSATPTHLRLGDGAVWSVADGGKLVQRALADVGLGHDADALSWNG